MNILGIIPARGGSKRVPRKNVRLLAGKPLIAYTIEAARASCIGRLIVSTDDAEIAEVARSLGVDVPFLRPVDLAQDSTPDQPVFEHALNWLGENERYRPDVIVHLRPTSPFKTARMIDSVVEKLVSTGVEQVRTVSRVEGVHHPYWMFKEVQESLVPFVDGVQIKEFYQSQLLPPAFRINGVVDAMLPSLVWENRMLDPKSLNGVILSEPEALDIDTEWDFEACELILSKRMV